MYWLRLFPLAQHELTKWEALARRIPDPELRRQALGKLVDERLNSEAAALFAVLAPRYRRRQVVRLIVAYQVLYDFLDAVNEQPDATTLANGLRLHRSLIDALQPDAPAFDYYLLNPRQDDGGYLDALLASCREVIRALPTNTEILLAAAKRCAEGQSHNHAILESGRALLINWSLSHENDGQGYLWWELAAAGISCLAIHALIATASDPRTDTGLAASVDEAYFPSICALSALLDSLADYDTDARDGNHSFIAHYRDGAQAAERLVAIAGDALERIAPLPHPRRHRVILAGIVAYYLSCGSVSAGFPVAAAQELVKELGPTCSSMCAVMRIRRRLQRRGPHHAKAPPVTRPTPQAPSAPVPSRR